MDILEKARAYDEALEKAKKELQACDSTDCDAARQIFRFFPELKESEDEKVRKEIIDYCHERLNTTYGALPNIETIKRWLTWLENQGKQKPPVIDFKAKNWYVSKVDGKIYDMTYNPTDKKELKKLTQPVTKTSEQVPSLLDLKLMDCPLSVRTLNALRLWDKPTKDLALRDLVGCTKKELLGARNFGNTMLKEVEDFLSEYGLKLKGE